MEIVSALGGAVGGLLGPVLGFFKARSDHKHEENMARISIEEVKAEADASVKVAQEATRGLQVKGDIDVRKASYKEASTALSKGQAVPGWAAGALALVDVIRAMIRPMIVVGAGLAAIFATNPDPVIKHAFLIATTWYFGERSAGRALGQLPANNAPPGSALKAWGVPPDKLNKLAKTAK